MVDAAARGIGQNLPRLVAATLAQTREQTEERIEALESERRGLVRQRQRDDASLRAARLADEAASVTRSAERA